MSEENKAIVRRLTEAAGDRNYDVVLRALMAAGSVAHLPLGDHYGPDGIVIDAAEWRKAFSDLEIVLLDLLAERDRVARRFQLSGLHLGPFLSLAPTGRPMEITGIAIDRALFAADPAGSKEIVAAAASPVPSPITTIIDVRDIRLLRDGRAGAFIIDQDPVQSHDGFPHLRPDQCRLDH